MSPLNIDPNEWDPDLICTEYAYHYYDDYDFVEITEIGGTQISCCTDREFDNLKCEIIFFTEMGDDTVEEMDVDMPKPVSNQIRGEDDLVQFTERFAKAFTYSPAVHAYYMPELDADEDDHPLTKVGRLIASNM